MASLSRITNTFFVTLINRLGIRPPPPEGFQLSNVVQPVSIVDSDVVLTAISTSAILDVPFTAGILIAAAGGTVFADTGPQAAGNYNIRLWLSSGNAAIRHVFDIQRRDAPNAANIWVQRVSLFQGTQFNLDAQLTIDLNINERLRIISVTAGDAATDATGNIWISPL